MRSFGVAPKMIFYQPLIEIMLYLEVPKGIF
jgi:hypothetical protein